MLRKYLTLIVMIALALPAAVASADGANDVFCGDLSQSDCQILLDNAAVMDSLNAFAVHMNMALDIDGAEPTRLSVQGDGQFELDAESLQTINEMAVNAGEAEWNDLAELFLTSAKAVVWVEMTESTSEEDVTTEINLLLKDGILVISADALSALTGEDMTGMEGFGIDLNDAIGDLLAESGMLPEADSAEMQEMENLADSTMSITRLPDSDVSGVAVAVFKTDFDLAAFFSLVSPEQLMAASGDRDDSLMLGELMDSIEVGEFSATHSIGLDDRYSYRIEVTADMSMSYTENGQQQTSSIRFEMVASLSSFGEPVDVAIPQDIFAFPLAMLLQMNENG